MKRVVLLSSLNQMVKNQSPMGMNTWPLQHFKCVSPRNIKGRTSEEKGRGFELRPIIFKGKRKEDTVKENGGQRDDSVGKDAS